MLLSSSRNAIRYHIPTPLSRATNFLYGDYKTTSFWWEPLEMIRKLVLTGGVLMIGDGESELARVLAALLFSIVFLAVHFSVKPLKRPVDGALTTLIELGLVLAYTCVLVIKTCEGAPETRRSYGFGDDAAVCKAHEFELRYPTSTFVA
jgi:hypothetical protein